MAQKTFLQLRTDIKERPGFRLIKDSATVLTEIDRAIKLGIQDYYESKYTTSRRYEAQTALAGLTIPTGTAVVWGSNGKLYEMTLTTTGAIPDNIALIKSLWVINDTNVVTYSSSTYDGEDDEGTGIPDASDDTALSTSNVFHELVGGDSSILLRLYVGTTAFGTTGKLHLKYIRVPSIPSVDADRLDIPDAELHRIFLPLVDSYLQQTFGFSQ